MPSRPQSLLRDGLVEGLGLRMSHPREAKAKLNAINAINAIGKQLDRAMESFLAVRSS